MVWIDIDKELHYAESLIKEERTSVLLFANAAQGYKSSNNQRKIL
jgi:hypothetical protein